MSPKLTDLSPIEGTPSQDDVLMIVSDGETKQITVAQITGYAEEAIIKCESCGQWGAIKTECKHCGGPIG